MTEGFEPVTAHVSDLPASFPAREVVAPALELVARDLGAPAVTFFTVDRDEEAGPSAAYGSCLAPRDLVRAVEGWHSALREVDPLTPATIAAMPGRVVTQADVAGLGAGIDLTRLRRVYRRIGMINDVRVPIRDGSRLVGGITLWRVLGSGPWPRGKLRLLESLQPLLELAYVSAARGGRRDGWLPKSLTPRQAEVARLLADGATDAELMSALRISPNTAKSHVRAVLHKLGVASRREVVRVRGVQPPEPVVDGGLSPRGLLSPLLDFAATRLGALGGGCLLLSPRGEPVAEAWRAARPGNGFDDRARSLHGAVMQAVREGGGEPAAALLGELGPQGPALLPLRPRGRLAGLVWLCGDDRNGRDPNEPGRVLRRLGPLLELLPLRDDSASPLPPRSGGVASRGLTPRELAVAEMAMRGASNDEIATRFAISVSTVKSHVTRILVKCGVRSRTQLIAIYGAAGAKLGEAPINELACSTFG